MTAEALLGTVRPHVENGHVPGAIVGVLRDGEVSLAATGATTPGGPTPLTVDTPVRISSMTKPIMAVLALALAEAGRLDLTDPVERLVPELAGPRVLRRLDGPLDDTVPADRSPTVEDLLTMRLGFGFVPEGPCAALDAAGAAGLGLGPPDPSVPLTPDAWIEAFAALPLLDQPGTTWRYDLSYGVLGVVLARAGGAPLDQVVRDLVLDPLGMVDTGFVAPPGRLPPSFVRDGESLSVLDEAGTRSRWAAPPAFPDARGGLVSTAADVLRLAGALLDGGAGILSPGAVRAMTSDRLTPEQRRAPSAGPFLDGSGWGYGVQVSRPDDDSPARAARHGWAGGLGTLWYSWPEHSAAAVLLTQVMPPTAELFTPFVDAAEALLAPA